MDLTSLEPVFVENGCAHLYCEYNFKSIKCTVSGFILGQKSYLATAEFSNEFFERIGVFLVLSTTKSFSEFDKVPLKTHPTCNVKESATKIENKTFYSHSMIDPIIARNMDSINLFTNYMMLFGANGTNIDIFINNPNERNSRFEEKCKFYKLIQSKTMFLFLLFHIRLVNYL